MKCNCHSHGSFLTAKGLEETAQQLSLEGLDPRGDRGYIDRVGSVSGSRRDEAHWDYELLEEQYRRFHHELSL